MSQFGLIIVTAIYAGQAVAFAAQGRWSAFLIIFGYATANCGLIWSLRT